MVKILKFLNINCAIGIFSPRHNQTLHFSSERAALWHPGTSLSTSSFLCVSKNIARIAKAALHNLPGKSSLNLYMGIEKKIYIFLSYRCGGLAILWLLWPPRTLGTELQAEKVKQVSLTMIMMVVMRVVVVSLNSNVFEIILLIRREFWAARDDWEQMMKQPYMIDYIRVYQRTIHD